jgi:hypothetical protein
MTDIHAEDPAECHSVSELFEDRPDTPRADVASTLSITRLSTESADGELRIKLDRFLEAEAACCFVRVRPKRPRDMSFVVSGGYHLGTAEAGGWLMRPLNNNMCHYWLPQRPTLRRLDAWDHILEERVAPISGFRCSPSEISLSVRVPDGWVLDYALWRFPPSSATLLDELQRLIPLEKQARFLWGSHTVYRCAADLYMHLIHGQVYENRSTWPKNWKIFSENDAHALYTTLSGLELATGKRLYPLLKQQLVASALERQGEDGGWRHGEWTDRMEAHFRLHCSAMHMLMDALEEKQDGAIRNALERAAAFLSRQVDRLDVGAWLLHDELEHSVEAMREGPFRWLPSRALGKSPANMLVLNSHLDGTVALHRYGKVTGNVEHEALVQEARRATRAVMSMRPASRLYSAIFRAVRLTFLPSAKAAALSLHLRALKRLAWKYLVPFLPRIKSFFPRIAMPGGYIDRELSLRVFAHDYLPINLMDLLRHARQFPEEANEDAVGAGFSLIDECRMFERWPEIGKAYAIGFWAEALYHACLIHADAEYRSRLARAVLELEKRALGLPPSLLGANGEAVALDEQMPTPLVTDPRVRVVNLCAKNRAEVLLVNCGSEPVRMFEVQNVPQGLRWSIGSHGAPGAALPDEIPAQGWLWGRASRPRPAAV